MQFRWMPGAWILELNGDWKYLSFTSNTYMYIEIFIYIHINVSMYIDMYEYTCIIHLHVCMRYMFYDICIM